MCEKGYRNTHLSEKEAQWLWICGIIMYTAPSVPIFLIKEKVLNVIRQVNLQDNPEEPSLPLLFLSVLPDTNKKTTKRADDERLWNVDLVAITAGRSHEDSTHIMLLWTLWRKQLFLSYIQLVSSCADVRGRGPWRAVGLTPSSHSNKLYIVMALKQQRPAASL